MTEQASVDERLDWKKARVVAAGLDIGAVSAKAVILVDGQPYASSRVVTRSPGQSATRALHAAIGTTGLSVEDIHAIVATGRGRAQADCAQTTFSEIACAAAGAVHVWGPSVRTVLDAGGESCKVIHSTEKGRATSFLWNDKCAAGIGRSIETFAELAGTEIAEIGALSLQAEQFPKLSDFCPVYAQSEALDLVRTGVPAEQLIAAYHHAMARRISILVGRSVLKKDFVIIGGLAKNPGITDRLEQMLGVERLAPPPGWDPEMTVALGAALFAQGSAGRK